MLVTLLAAGCARGAYVRPSPAPATRAAANVVPAGTLASAQLQQPLSTKLTHVGDRFTAELLDPLVDGDGREVVARGAVLEGQVADLDASRVAGDRAGFELSLTGVRTQGDGVVLLPLEIAQAPVEVPSGWGSGFVGGLAGAVAGGGAALAFSRDSAGISTGSAIVGAGVGVFVGTLFGRRDAELPSGSVLTLRVTKDLALSTPVTGKSARAPRRRGSSPTARAEPVVRPEAIPAGEGALQLPEEERP